MRRAAEFSSRPLSRPRAYVTFAAEAARGALLVLGIWTRWVAVALLLPLFGAIVWYMGPMAGCSRHREAAGNTRVPDRGERRPRAAQRRRARGHAP